MNDEEHRCAQRGRARPIRHVQAIEHCACATRVARTTRVTRAARAALVAVAALVTLAGLAPDAALAAGADPAPAAQAGLATRRIRHHDTAIEVALWYPSTATERVLGAGPFRPRAAPDAPVLAGRHPLVLLSHGTGGMNLNHHDLAAALARAGFVVASLTHPGDNFRDRSLIADPRYFVERPRQVSRVLDALLADPDWAARLDATRIAAIGHSAGGYTVAALLGARPDLARLGAHCRAHRDDPACAYRDPSVGVTDASPTPFRLPADSPTDSRADSRAGSRADSPAGADVADARIRAGVLLAPMGAVIAPDSLGAVRGPLRLIGAERDEVLARPYHYDYLREGLSGADASLAAGAGHFSFIAPIAPEWRSALGPVAEDPPEFDRAAFHERLGPELARWLTQALKQDSR